MIAETIIFFSLLMVFVSAFILRNISQEKKDIQIRETISKIESQQRLDNIRLKTNKLNLEE